MSNSIGELSDRARDVFRLVVEAYLDSGQNTFREKAEVWLKMTQIE